MKNSIFLLCVLVLTCTSCTTDRDIASKSMAINPDAVLLYYWHFNTVSGNVTQVASDYSATPFDATISYPGSGAGYMDSFNPGYGNNARLNESGGNGLRVRNPSNTRSLVFEMPTTGFKKPVLRFAVARTSSGATTQQYTYTTDGLSYTKTGLSISTFNPNEDPSSDVVILDFSLISAADNNPKFKIKIEFLGDNASASTGNNRFDNITLEGIPN